MSTAGLRAAVAALALFVIAGCASVAPDYAREQRLADQIVPSIVVGEATQLLSISGHRFLGIITPVAKPRAGVLLVHSMGVHPDFGVTGELRAMLADRGYTTLSIQMPVLASDAAADDYPALFPEAGERIAAGLAHLRARGLQKVAIVAHSMGARMVNDFIAHRPEVPLIAWVSLTIANGQLGSLSGVRFPVFDIYAEKDFDVVMKGARARAAVLRGIKGSKQAMVFGTDHYFTRKEREVASLVDQLLTPLAK
jgi:alpha/beta superfamily hydrolase